MDKKLKILVWSDLVTKTGFERVSSSIFENLTEQMDIVGLGINYRGDPNKYKFPVFPAGATGGDIYGMSRISEFVEDGLDIIFILNDVWVIDKFLDTIKSAWKGKKLPLIATYFPIDAEEHDQTWYKNFDIVDLPVTYTEFGKKVVLKAEPMLTNRLKVIPHGTDIETFFRLNRMDARRKLFGDKATDDFIFLNANRNQPRKKLDITMEGFKLFAENKKDVRLYMHCGVIDMHLDIAKLAVRLGIDRQLILSNLGRGPQQVSEKLLNYIYNSCDVGINTGLGEGWGLTSVEHACTGAPQVVPDSSACRELFSDCGVLVPTKASWTFDNTMTVGKLVTPEGVAEALERLYTDTSLYNSLSKKSIRKFTAPEYQWKTISQTWYKLFEETYAKSSLANQATK